jgi:hypothetical protein
MPMVQALQKNWSPTMPTYTNPRIIVYNDEHMKAACEFADRTKQRDQLESCLNDLARMAENNQAYAHLFTDFVPHSFYFEIYRTPDREGRNRSDRLWNGGVIYHGPLEDGSTPETFSVSLTHQRSWSIHT